MRGTQRAWGNFSYGSGNVAPEDTDHYGLIFDFLVDFLVLFSGIVGGFLVGFF